MWLAAFGLQHHIPRLEKLGLKFQFLKQNQESKMVRHEIIVLWNSSLCCFLHLHYNISVWFTPQNSRFLLRWPIQTQYACRLWNWNNSISIVFIYIITNWDYLNCHIFWAFCSIKNHEVLRFESYRSLFYDWWWYLSSIWILFHSCQEDWKVQQL